MLANSCFANVGCVFVVSSLSLHNDMFHGLLNEISYNIISCLIAIVFDFDIFFSKRIVNFEFKHDSVAFCCLNV